MNKKLFVAKRDGRKEEVSMDKITERIQKLCNGLNMDSVDPFSITVKVIESLNAGVTTSKLDVLAAEIAAMKMTDHPDYLVLATRLAISKLHKDTKESFSDVIDDLFNAKNEYTGKQCKFISDFHHKIVMKNSEKLDSCINHGKDFSYNYYEFKTLEKCYLLQMKGKIFERPQHMLMRVAVGIHGEDVDSAIETYKYLSEKYFTHATPTLFAAARSKAQLCSYFSLMMPEDSIVGIYKCLSSTASISKYCGDIGVNIHNIRATGTYIEGTTGISNGLVPMLRVFNHTAKFVKQLNNKPGRFTIHLEPWHADIFDFLNLKKNIGKEEMRARDLVYALWISNLFVKRVEEDGIWSLMCPRQSPGLSDCWGDNFEKLYKTYEDENNFIAQIPARKLWKVILDSQIATGGPQILYKDGCNYKSNHQNLGTIKGSSLCADIVQYTGHDEIGVCCTASIAVNMFVKSDKKTYDFEKLKLVTKIVTRNLNKIIDVNYYPAPEAETSNLRHRPIGIGVQGLADAFILMRMPFDSEDAKLLNIKIFETIYFSALEASCEIAKKDGPYSSYEGSPVSRGILQYDMWNVTPSNLWNWAKLKAEIMQHGLRNSLLMAQSPTVNTAELLGNSESVEPYKSYIDTYHVFSNKDPVVNHHLVKDLTDYGLWSDEMKNQIVANCGSIQNIPSIPQDLKNIYKTAWEISQRIILNMAADRGAFIDQSQSLNIFIKNPSYGQLCSMHIYGWKLGLKTGMYNLITK